MQWNDSPELRIISCDPGFIAYISNRGGHNDLWLYNPINGVNTQLTFRLGASFSKPYWSPDRKQIAFVGKYGIIYVVYFEPGSGIPNGTVYLSSIDQLEEAPQFLDWSHDGQRLAYVKGDRIMLYDVHTHLSHSIMQNGASDVNWFPNGEELLYQAPDESGTSQLYRIRTNGSGKRQVTQNSEGTLHDARLSPDGQYALYTTPGTSIAIIYTVELSTGKTFEIKGGPLAKNYYPVWSPDSMRIAYCATATDQNQIAYKTQIRTVGREGEDDIIWAVSNCFATPVTWSPDGTKLAYLSGCTEMLFAHDMFVFDLRSQVPYRIIADVLIAQLSWSICPGISQSDNVYTNKAYHVSLHYPGHWQQVTPERFEGPDGFFQISAIAGGDNMDEVCRNEAFHILNPYGSAPRIDHSNINGQQACYIFPSMDQPAEMKGQAALIVRYRVPIQIEGETYKYFILWADQVHLIPLAATLVINSNS